MTNEYDGLIRGCARKGGMVHSEILLPDHAPREYFDRVVSRAVRKLVCTL